MSREKSESPSVFEYDNYRAFLGDTYNFLKRTKPCFSYRYFSEKAGFRSPNFLKLVIEGKRNLSPDSIQRFVHALKLKKAEGEFFRILVHLNQARTIDEKKLYAEQILRSRPFRHIHPIRKDQYDYYSRWFHIPVRELVRLSSFTEDPDWIAKALVPPISPQQARKALELLQGLGLLTRDPTGRLVQTDTLITTGDEVTSASVKDYHREMIRKAIEALDGLPANERDISSVTLALSEKSFRQVKTLIQQFRKELLGIAGQDQNPERVCQVNLQMFPLTGMRRRTKRCSEEE